MPDYPPKAIEITTPEVRWPAEVTVYGCFRCRHTHMTFKDLCWCYRKVTPEPKEHDDYVIKNYRMSD